MSLGRTARRFLDSIFPSRSSPSSQSSMMILLLLLSHEEEKYEEDEEQTGILLSSSRHRKQRERERERKKTNAFRCACVYLCASICFNAWWFRRHILSVSERTRRRRRRLRRRLKVHAQHFFRRERAHHTCKKAGHCESRASSSLREVKRVSRSTRESS